MIYDFENEKGHTVKAASTVSTSSTFLVWLKINSANFPSFTNLPMLPALFPRARLATVPIQILELSPPWPTPLTISFSRSSLKSWGLVAMSDESVGTARFRIAGLALSRIWMRDERAVDWIAAEEATLGEKRTKRSVRIWRSSEAI